MRLALLLKEKGGRLGLVLVVILSMTIHPLQYRSLELDMQETSATEVCESPSSPSKLEFLSGQRASNSAGVSSRHARNERH